MSYLIRQLQERKRLLEALVSSIEIELQSLPEGSLRLSKKNGVTQYYQVTETDGSVTKKYINSSNRALAKELAQKGYDVELIRAIDSELKAIHHVLAQGKILSSDDVFKELGEGRRALVRPYLLDDETYAEMSQRQSFEANPFHPEHLIYPTKRGEKVRSKSESMIADMYYELDVPYLYDVPVSVGKGKVKYVDFVLLHKTTRKIYYHEHLGRLDDPGYRKESMQKLDLYRQNGIYTGKNLILTHETEDSPLNMRVLRKNTMELFGISQITKR